MGDRLGAWKNPYPGDTAEKQIARLVLYRHAKAAPVQGHAVTLAGTEPFSEVRLIRDYLNWPAHRSWFIDKSRSKKVSSALRKISSTLWEGANVRNLDIREIIPHLEAIGFANLDFMGAPLSNDNIDCLTMITPLLLPDSILGFTWIRGREILSLHSSARRLWRFGKGFKGNERRWAGVLRAVDKISKGNLMFVDGWEYFSNHSPMSVAIFRKL